MFVQQSPGCLDGLADGDRVDSEQVAQHLLRTDLPQVKNREQDLVRVRQQGTAASGGGDASAVAQYVAVLLGPRWPTEVPVSW
ncbi:hypothetical protein ROS62_27275 [Streptomyces sp. DSM 41972]|uniref:Uncharacterized protein n=1 Tax=Streptomyces althioticus subsp. attaecolombicae TaxID=3075534 RepID=A0ABU3I8H9_9ACTN|nr:hypothetical protein [Streptomyces sp. DSM 41972]